MTCHSFAGTSRSCFHGVPLIVPVPVDEKLKALAVSAHREAAVAAEAGIVEVDSDDTWGAPLVEYLTTHAPPARGSSFLITRMCFSGMAEASLHATDQQRLFCANRQ